MTFKRWLPVVQIQQQLSARVNDSIGVHTGDYIGRESGGINGGFMGRSEAPPAVMDEREGDEIRRHFDALH